MSKTMSVELIDALKAAGIEVVASKVELSMDERVEKIRELKDLHAILLEAKDTTGLKKVRRQLRSLGFYLSHAKKALSNQ